eukprot:Sspe_Gene.1874::Locus_620_Transcript_14_16_Confidence_0.351_Length_2575::g.1874::m.1874
MTQRPFHQSLGGTVECTFRQGGTSQPTFTHDPSSTRGSMVRDSHYPADSTATTAPLMLTIFGRWGWKVGEWVGEHTNEVQRLLQYIVLWVGLQHRVPSRVGTQNGEWGVEGGDGPDLDSRDHVWWGWVRQEGTLSGGEEVY